MNGPFGLLQSLADGMKLMFRGLHADGGRQVVFIAPFVVAIPAITAFAVIDGRNGAGAVHRDHHATAGHRSAGIGAVHRRGRLDRGVRHRACGLVVRIDVLAAGRIALERAGDQLRSRDGSRTGRRLPLRRLAVNLRDRRKQAEPATVFGVPVWFAVQLLPSFIIYVISMVGETNRAPFDLPGRRASWSGFPHRVLLDAIRDVLHG